MRSAGALMIDLGARRGLRPAPSAGAGVATVDGIYAVAAAWCGAALADAAWSTAERFGFAAGAFAASLAWCALRTCGAALLRGIPPRGRTAVIVACQAAVLGVAAGVVLGR